MKPLVTLLLFFSITLGYGQNAIKKPLDVTQIEQIELMKLNKENPHKFQSKMMYNSQFSDFAEKWLTSKSLGPEKFKLVEYYVFVTLKNGEKRQFTISGANAVGCKLQESESATFEIKDKFYFDNLWTAIR